MPLISRLVVALTPDELRTFLPERLAAGLGGLASQVDLIDTTDLAEASFHAHLERLNPEVLVGCWRTPSLPGRLPSSLKYVCYLGGSVRRLVTRAHLEEGLVVSNWGASISRVVAESALMLALASLRRAGKWMPAMQRDGSWKDSSLETASLFGRTVGIHGFGRVAQELTKLLRPFGVPIGICAPETDEAHYARHGARKISTLEELFSSNDVIFDLAPLIPATTGMITEALLRRIRPGGVFINVGRGAVVDEAALCAVAREGKIQVGLDVYATEPLPADSGLRNLPNVILSPHIGGPTTDRRRDAGAFGLANLRAYTEGRALESIVTPAVYDTAS